MSRQEILEKIIALIETELYVNIVLAWQMRRLLHLTNYGFFRLWVDTIGHNHGSFTLRLKGGQPHGNLSTYWEIVNKDNCLVRSCLSMAPEFAYRYAKEHIDWTEEEGSNAVLESSLQELMYTVTDSEHHEQLTNIWEQAACATGFIAYDYAMKQIKEHWGYINIWMEEVLG